MLAGRAAAESEKIAAILKQIGIEPFRAPTMASVKQILRERWGENLCCAFISEDIEGKSGLECAAWLFQQDPNLSCIIVADKPDNDLLIKSLRLGICDAVSASVGPEELRRSLERAMYLTNYRRGAFMLAKRVHEGSQTYRRLVSDRRQPALAKFMPEYDKRLETALFPALEAGGDMGNSFVLDDHRFIMIGGDVSGHDVGSGFVSAFIMGLGRGMAAKGAQPDEIRQHINDFLVKEWNPICPPGEIIVSVGSCPTVLDFEKMLVHCSCYGFPQPVLCDDKLKITLLGTNNPPLGWFDEPLAPPIVLSLPETGCITMFSDGLTDLGKSDKSCALAMADAVLGLSQEQATCASILEMQRDDIFVQRFSWSKGNRNDENLLRPIFHSVCHVSDIDDIDNCQKRWGTVLSTSLPGLAHDRRNEILLCCREAVLNALEHGCKCQAGNKSEITMACVGRNNLKIRVDAPKTNNVKGAEKETGHIPFGLKIIKGYSNSYDYDLDNNVLLLNFTLDSPKTADPTAHKQTFEIAENLP